MGTGSRITTGRAVILNIWNTLTSASSASLVKVKPKDPGFASGIKATGRLGTLPPCRVLLSSKKGSIGSGASLFYHPHSPLKAAQDPILSRTSLPWGACPALPASSRCRGVAASIVVVLLPARRRLRRRAPDICLALQSSRCNRPRCGAVALCAAGRFLPARCLHSRGQYPGRCAPCRPHQ